MWGKECTEVTVADAERASAETEVDEKAGSKAKVDDIADSSASHDDKAKVVGDEIMLESVRSPINSFHDAGPMHKPDYEIEHGFE